MSESTNSEKKKSKPKRLVTYNEDIENIHLFPIDKSLINDRYLNYIHNYNTSKRFSISLFSSFIISCFLIKRINPVLLLKTRKERAFFNLHLFFFIYLLIYDRISYKFYNQKEIAVVGSRLDS